ncbi:hypothetical protein BJV77DRAFT_529009 [Russula vinacea]|nr:hypothetical protein BJV77DRAFT_529009 [Russula vinacea]
MSLPCDFDQERLEHLVSPACSAIAPPPSPCCPKSYILTETQAHYHDGTWEESTSMNGGRSQRVTIDNLPDLVLLGIFDFYMGEDPDDEGIEAWHTLVHVCRNWRNVVFGSPRRLNLQLYCTARTPVKQTLDVWPLFPSS